MNRIRKSKAFTLIELIVVVIIIGVLAMIASVAYNQFVTQARDKAVLTSAAEVAKAINAAASQAGTSPDAQINGDAAASPAIPAATYAGTLFTVGGIKVNVTGLGTPTTTPPATILITQGNSKACVTGGPTTADTASSKAGTCP